MAFASLAFVACNNDETPANGAEEDRKGEVVEAISIAFKNPSSTYAYEGTIDGQGTENDVYTAYVFAKEIAPEHPGALAGDWTVKEVKNGGSALVPGDGTTAGTLKNMCTFKGVRQGDHVYVIANDKTMTLPIAEGLAHRGEESEAAIQRYIASIDKSDLAAMAVKKDNEQNKPFIMSGQATIPTDPTIANNSTVTIPVELSRELAKVTFSATVSNESQYEAYGRVQINSGDGLVVVRMPRTVSFFTEQARDWYFPLDAEDAAKDWDVTGWLTAFDGATKADAAGTSGNFNATAKDGAKEYRFTWDTNSSLVTATDLGTINAKLASPYFYVTPNYANHSGCAEVIVTQATYTGAPVFLDEKANTLFIKAYGKYITGNESDFKDASGANASAFSQCAWTDAAMAKVSAYFANVTATKADLATVSGLTADEVTAAAAIITQVTRATAANALLDYYTGQKLYYRADIANYDDTNAISRNVTERNTFYQIQGTITSLGAKSIEDAINNDNISMIVEVSVKKWNLVVNRVNM